MQVRMVSGLPVIYTTGDYRDDNLGRRKLALEEPPQG